MNGLQCADVPLRNYSLTYSVSVLSVVLVYCGQTVGWTTMKLGTQVGLGLGHIVLDVHPAPSQWGTAPNFRPIFVVAKWLDGSTCHLVRR